MALASVLLEILGRPTIGDVLSDLMIYMAPLWIGVIVGVLIGWTWKPTWANLGWEMLNSSISKASRETASSSSESPIGFGSFSMFDSLKVHLPGYISWTSDDGVPKDDFSVPPTDISECSGSLSELENEKPGLVNGDDLEHFCKLVEVKDEGPAWIHMMDRSTPNMTYQAWRRDPKTGPPQYRSKTIFENATPEMVRDFFWDDEFRLKWDDMIVSAETLEECPTTGNMVVHWVRKFPFFCSDREYIIGRRIWESGHLYYCVTKGVPCSTVPRCNKPRRVDLYYSSWCIRAVESKRGNGQLTACEVLLFHHEDMGIPWEIARIGVRQGMWGAAKKVNLGFRAYQKERASGAPLSRCAFMAQINTKVRANYLRSLESSSSGSSDDEVKDLSEKPLGRNIPKLLVVGGAVVLACSLDRGLLTKAVIFGVARRFANIGRRL
ncbi:hypothetical protein HS088_TW16G00817 [Tripterygium wilfordii]|uniref:START domain-containing protein n=1 Tax=Tripterygium wilfordii TaxID=458696 RepID=A0A7J7CJZ3_TRIWF|nr:uncharacterized protein LOC119981187 [Tripterygium wilfordii]KAF5734368.1 hypothetical protein HS088_TW16G00817 [Tripterygium wilfordii]